MNGWRGRLRPGYVSCLHFPDHVPRPGLEPIDRALLAAVSRLLSLSPWGARSRGGVVLRTRTHGSTHRGRRGGAASPGRPAPKASASRRSSRGAGRWRFSRASRMTSCCAWSEIGGCPVEVAGRSSVGGPRAGASAAAPGVAPGTPASVSVVAAGSTTASSAQLLVAGRDRGCWRCSTASSWRSTRISISLASADRRQADQLKGTVQRQVDEQPNYNPSPRGEGKQARADRSPSPCRAANQRRDRLSGPTTGRPRLTRRRRSHRSPPRRSCSLRLVRAEHE
jgi:hypothetical protein